MKHYEEDMLKNEIEDLVKLAYRDLLGREPEKKGLTYYVDLLSCGYDYKSFLLDIINSEEFKNKFKPDPKKFQQDEDIYSDKIFVDIYDLCREFTMTSIYNMYALFNIIRYVVARKIPGDFVECGVWRGGSAMLAAMALLKLGDNRRKIYLYDTYEGMSRPGVNDIRHDGASAEPIWLESQTGDRSTWALASIEEVTYNMKTTSYPMDKVVFVKGKVEDTLPFVMPDRIAVLRLDTDWYESTLHELTTLFPLVQKGGVLIIDDFGWWKGCRRAVDEYFADKPILLTRICVSGARVGVKL